LSYQNLQKKAIKKLFPDQKEITERRTIDRIHQKRNRKTKIRSRTNQKYRRIYIKALEIQQYENIDTSNS
jgi:hypothetical protein